MLFLKIYYVLKPMSWFQCERLLNSEHATVSQIAKPSPLLNVFQVGRSCLSWSSSRRAANYCFWWALPFSKFSRTQSINSFRREPRLHCIYWTESTWSVLMKPGITNVCGRGCCWNNHCPSAVGKQHGNLLNPLPWNSTVKNHLSHALT